MARRSQKHVTMAHQTTYYLEINGDPSCVSSLYPRMSPAWSCSQGTSRVTAEAQRLLVLRDPPDAVVMIREGFCPAYGDAAEADRESREWEEERVRSSLEDPYNE